METMEYTGKLVVVTCWCGLKHAVPEDLDRQLKEGIVAHLYCPLGHRYVVDPSETTKLKAQISSLRDTLDTCRKNRDMGWWSQAATKGHVTRLKKRVAGG